MFAFDRWRESARPETLKDYLRRSGTEQAVALWDWRSWKYNHPPRGGRPLEVQELINHSERGEKHV